jgi:glycine oxidase
VIVVIGAGLIGLAVAHELAKRGSDVRVLEAAEPAGAASWAGAGMLAPDTEETPSAAMRAICAYGLALYPSFVEGLHEESGLDARLRRDGILKLAFTPQTAALGQARVIALNREGVAAHWLSRSETIAMEPAVSGSILGAAFVEREGHVDNRRLGRALRVACERRAVRIDGGRGAIAIETDARRVRGVRTGDGFLQTSLVINAAGAWASEVPGVPEFARVAVHPVKGQMLALAMPRGLVQRAVWYPDGYAVPREDGRLLIGATVEATGFDVRVTASGIKQLLDGALNALPALRDLALTETWAGLRPGTVDGLPYIGLGALDGYAVATGHYRNGILLAPATARLLADLIERCAPAVDPLAFSPLRTAPEWRSDVAAKSAT